MTQYGLALVVSSTTRPTTAPDLVFGRVIAEADTSRILWYDGVGWIILYEPWQTAFASVLTQGVSVNIAKTLQTSNYRREGGECTWNFRFDATAAGTAGSPATLTLPVAAAVSVATPGVGMVYDSSATQRYVCHLEFATTSTIAFGCDGVFAANWGLTPNLAIASSDQFRGQASYQMGSIYS